MTQLSVFAESTSIDRGEPGNIQDGCLQSFVIIDKVDDDIHSMSSRDEKAGRIGQS